MTFLYKGKPISSHDDLLANCTDIVYELTFKSGRKYIGKKSIRSIRRLKPTKAQLAIRKNYVRKELVNLPFVDYEGSSSENQDEVVVMKEILYCCSTKKAATYLETALLFTTNAILTDSYTNKNILGKFYDNDLDGLIEGD